MNQPFHEQYIVHITPRSLWEQSQETGIYRGDTLDTQGFIHCSTVEQVLAVANAVFLGQDDLVLLLIDTSRVLSPLQYEGDSSGLFPHIYGPLYVDAVVAVYDFPPDEHGRFQ